MFAYILGVLMIKVLRKHSLPLVLLFVSACLGFFLIPKPPLLEEVSFSRAVFDNQQHLLRLTLSQDDKYRLYTPLEKIAPELIEATLLQEDQYFYWHLGINPLATLKAIWQTYGVKSRRVGASTITMQLARILYGLNSKTVAGKIWQMIYAIRLELHYSKKQLLEAYLNLVPYGNNVEGIGAASLIYFAKPAEKLSLPEALTLSVIPQNPVQRISALKKLENSRKLLFTRWLTNHPQDKNIKAFMELPLQLRKIKDLPFLAPQFVSSVLAYAPEDQSQIVTTLDLRLQKMVEQLSHQYVERKKNNGVNNVAVLLVDTRDMSIKAHVGSADFYNNAIGGQIDGTWIKRSPGSTLKPFIFALALDQGLIHPGTVLKDVPRSFGTYNPENFDYEFMGPIRAKDALTLSRNIPAIYLAEQLSHPNLYEFLESANIKQLKSQTFYGLSLVLGGAPVSMQELASLYVMLVNDGVWYPLRKLHFEGIPVGKHLLSREASYLVLDMLKDSETSSIPVSWKTGTSSGFRDAWAVGTFGQYVLVVWLGNFDNRSNPAFVGKTLAAPLLFELIDNIYKQTEVVSIPKNPNAMNLTKIAVCKASGMLPTRYCKDTEMTWFIPGKSPIKTDTIYREIPIDKKTGLRACQFDENTRFEIYEFWPTDLLRIFKQAGIQRRIPPDYGSTCKVDQNGLIPQITSPQLAKNYVLRSHALEGNIIPFAATVDADVRSMYWFVNESYVGVTKENKPYLWTAKPGKFTVRVVDDHGRADAMDLIVKIES